MNNYNEDVLNIDRTVLYAKKEFLKAVCNIAIINIIELSMSLKFLILKYNNNKDCFIFRS